MADKRTSVEWQELYPYPKVMDADGWDRKNFQYSWYEEEITYEEYRDRTMASTCIWKGDEWHGEGLA